MAIKIKDIANHTNVSPATISRVIHNSGYVNSEKRKIILQAIKDLNYVPNRVAQGLKGKKTKMIGHIIPQSFPNPYYSEISRGADLKAYEKGYHVLTLSSYRDQEREEMLIKDMMSRMVDGIIFSTRVSSESLEQVKKAGIHVVVIERMLDAIGVDKVTGDNFEGSYLATDYLIENNHKNIGYIGHECSSQIEIKRYEGYCAAMRNNNIPINEEFVKFTNTYSVEDGYKITEELIKTKNLPSAIYVPSDVLVTGVMQALYNANIKIPDDISIVSYDNTYSKFVSPPLTTVAAPMEQMGRTAVEMIINKVEKKENSLKTIILHPTIIERDSVKKL